MQSFRTEIENPVVEKDILDLERKIRLHHEGKIDDERFRSLRLARGIYGQRQPGVQMIRIKLPYGKVTSDQLLRIADVSDKYSTGNLHITTRQDIQIHYVSLDRTPELWAELEKSDITLREACGNTVRNITASELAGIDPKEPFDVRPYAHQLFEHFLRNPISQEMGRKFKISFSSSEEDSALSFMHDLGFIATVRNGQVGFRVLVAGGLGSQSRSADLIREFLPADQLIPFSEAVLRVFEHHGERNRRMKARLKFLVKELGFQTFNELVNQELEYVGNLNITPLKPEEQLVLKPVELKLPYYTQNTTGYDRWIKTSLIKQKQAGLHAIAIKVQLGNFSSTQARQLAELIKTYSGDEVTFTIHQNILIRHVRTELLEFFFDRLTELGLAEPGYSSTADITACPGTDTCNLGIASSTGIAKELEGVLNTEYPEFLLNQEIKIKISGCMNACGQHMIAHIGFQGMSIKTKDGRVLPALQVLLGGGNLGNGQGRFADKVIKIPSKKGPQVLRTILDHYKHQSQNNETFLHFYDRLGKIYFYDLLKPLAQTDQLSDDDYIDWGSEKSYQKAVGVGECAGVLIDLVETLFLESEEKLGLAKEAIEEARYQDSFYLGYQSIVNSAKALLLSEGQQASSQAGILKLFDQHFSVEQGFASPGYNLAMSYKNLESKLDNARSFLDKAKEFHQQTNRHRQTKLTHETA